MAAGRPLSPGAERAGLSAGEVASQAAQGLGSLLGRLPDYDGRRAVVASGASGA